MKMTMTVQVEVDEEVWALIYGRSMDRRADVREYIEGTLGACPAAEEGAMKVVAVKVPSSHRNARVRQ